MPPKSRTTTNASQGIATRSSSHTRVSSISAQAADPHPSRVTRSGKAIAPTSVPTASFSSRSRALASPISQEDAPSKRLRPITQSSSKFTVAKVQDKGAAVLAATKRALRPVTVEVREDKEPLKAYLRVRPDLSREASVTPSHLTVISPTQVQLEPPPHGSSTLAALRATLRLPTPRRQMFSFSKVFPPETTQPDFFAQTTLPSVKELLDGHNGLIFAYGVTNSGKTYTIQGKNNVEEAGIVPRTLDVVFNSIAGLDSAEIEKSIPASPKADELTDPANDDGEELFLRHLLPESEQDDWDVKDPTCLPIDKDYEYRVYISYVEIYQNNIYDLLGSSSDAGTSASSERTRPGTMHATPSQQNHSNRSSFMPSALSNISLSSWVKHSSSRLPASSSRLLPSASLNTSASHTPSGSTVLTRQALSLRNDPATGSRYIANLQSVRVHNAAEARRIVRLGQVNRRVFGTVANKESSRSHAILTIKVERVKNVDEDEEHEIIETSRLSIVDLAGSERNKITQATGERMDEANHINKSLMALGQCIRILRENQIKAHAAAAAGPGAPARSYRAEIPPYRLSKLTTIFQEFFEGHGKAVMIVNVNPYDTGFQENSNALEFAALASELTTVTNKVLPSLVKKEKIKGKEVELDHDEAAEEEESIVPPPPPARIRQVRLSVPGPKGERPVEKVFDIVEEEEEPDEDESEGEDGQPDPFVKRLLDELDMMRIRLYEAEVKCALVEAETREAVMQEMEERMREMEIMHARRLRNETEENELKMDRKIEMLSRTGAFGADIDEESEEDYELEDGSDHEESFNVEESLIDDRDTTASPTFEVPNDRLSHNTVKGPQNVSNAELDSSTRRSSSATDQAISQLHSSSKTQEQNGNEDDNIENESEATSEEASGSDEDKDEIGDEDEDEDEDDEWVPTSQDVATVEDDDDDDLMPTRKPRRSQPSSPAKSKALRHRSPSPLGSESVPEVDSTESRLPSESEKMVESPSQNSGNTHDDLAFPRNSLNSSVNQPVIVPNKKARQRVQGMTSEEAKLVPDAAVPGIVKKKKRHLGGLGASSRILTEDDIQQVTRSAESLPGNAAPLLKSTQAAVRRENWRSK